MKMRRKSRVKEEANSNFSSNHLIKEDSPRDDDPSPTGKKTRVRSVDHGSLHASDVAARYVNQSVYSKVGESNNTV